MTRISLAWALALVAAPALFTAGSARAATGPQFNINGQPANARSIEFDDVVTDGRVEIDLMPGSSRLQVFAPGAGIADLKPACELSLSDPKKLVLDRSTACKLFDPLWKGEKVDVLLGVEGSTAVARLTFTPPSAHPDVSSILVEPADEEKGIPWGKPKFPASALVESTACWLFLGKWFPLQCKNGQDIDLGPTAGAVHEMLAADDGKVPLYAFVSAGKPAWAKFEIAKKPPPPPKPPKPPEPPTVSGSLEDRCKEIKPAQKEYRICVDAMASGPRLVKMFECIPKDEDEGKNYCTEIGAVVSTNQGFRVLVWSNVDLDNVLVDFSGDVGYSSGFKELPARGDSKGTEAVPPPRAELLPVYDGPFAPRKSGEAKLTIKLKQKAKDNKTPPDIEISRDFLVRGSYWGAARLGLGFMWTPSAKTVGTAMGANNQRYVVVTGSEPAAPAPELVGGLSFFLDKDGVMEGEDGATWALGFRVGLLSLSESKVSTLRSFMAGIEVGKGLDYSVGAYGGIRLIDVPQRGYEPGTLITVEKVPTEINPALTLGFVLNVTPDFMKSLGLK